MSDIIDISQTLTPGLPVWPGDTNFQINPLWQIDDNCPVLVSRLTLSTHSGSHADAPSHYDRNGTDMADTGLIPYLGICHVVCPPVATGPVTFDEIEPFLDALDSAPKRLLIRTFESFPHDSWPVDFRPVDAGLVEKLAEMGCLLIGTDTPSLDPETSKTMDAHMAIKQAGMAILEGLVLDAVQPGAYELIALPLKIKDADASPVRAILRSLPI